MPMPSGVAVTSAALAPSPNSMKESTVSRSAASCKCSVQSSRFTTSTRAAGFGADDVVGGAQRGHAGIASHEPDQGPLDAGRHAQPRRQHLVQSRRGEAGAGCDDDMGEAGRVLAQRRHSLRCQLNRVAFVADHAGGGGGEAAAVQETLRIHLRGAGRPELQDGVAVFDAGTLGHAVEHRDGLSSGSKVRAKVTNPACTSCGGTAVPIRLMCGTTLMRNDCRPATPCSARNPPVRLSSGPGLRR